MYTSLVKKISVLRKLKINRDITIIVPVLEYACELWNRCTQQNSEKLEKAQREAAHII